ncbi:MAG: type II toxin-antitoxin system RelE/ParE family toxin [Myxococcota bacterium]
MSVLVETLPRAADKLYELELWWLENRSGARYSVLTAFEDAIDLLSESPEIGVPYRRSSRPHLRWLRLSKTPYLMVYEYIPGSGRVLVLAVWSAEADDEPSLG